MKTDPRSNITCQFKCPCGVEMLGTDTDLDYWHNQHITLSKIHQEYLLKAEMDRMVQWKEISDLIDELGFREDQP